MRKVCNSIPIYFASSHYPSRNLLANFFPFQKNALLRNHDPYRWPDEGPLLFRKPIEICEQSDIPLPTLWPDKFQFSLEWRTQIKRRVSAYGLSLRLMENDDIPAIRRFLTQHYPPELAAEICAFDLHRFMEYGHGVLLLDEQGEVKATIFEVGYHTPEKTSYTIRLAVSRQLKGKNLGHDLVIYSSLLAMEYGSLIKRGIIEFDNLHSLYINLNKVGWVCDAFIPEIKDLGAFFKIALPLDPMGLTGNVIGQERVIEFVQSRRKEIDYMLIPVEDRIQVERMYEQTTFVVTAVLRKGWIDDQDLFLALPSERLNLKRKLY